MAMEKSMKDENNVQTSASQKKPFIVDKYFNEIVKAWDKEHVKESSAGGHTHEPPSPSSRSLSSTSFLTDFFSQEHQVQYGRLTGQRNRRKKAVHDDVTSSSYDVIHLDGPLTEHALLQVLQTRFYAKQYYTSIGHVLLALNPQSERLSPRALPTNVYPHCQKQLLSMVNTATQDLQDAAISQTIILNGQSGSGKTFLSMLMVQQVYNVAGGGTETDSYKHMNAALTILRALTTAATCNNADSSRMGVFVQCYISDGAIHKTKINCYALDHARITGVQPKEKNYHVFYQMLAGLTQEERVKYHLSGYSIDKLCYLSGGDTTQDTQQDKLRFDAWKVSLSVLGIPIHDILRVLSAVLLLGNIHFVAGPGLDLEVHGSHEMKSVATLLGMSSVTLYRSLTSRSHLARGNVFKATTDPIAANESKDQLARALYARTLAAIIKRANRSRHDHTANSNSSNDSNDMLPAFRPRCVSRTSSYSSHLAAGNGDIFVGILDMFGFEQLEANELEQLCINLCAETLQHFYNTHIFKSTEQACIEEGIQADMDVNYMENAPIVELISSQRTGILSLLDRECHRGNPQSYMHQIRIQHKANPHFVESPLGDSDTFVIRHFAVPVQYDISNFLSANEDRLTDDVVWAFSKTTCNSGFTSHLFNHDLKALQESGGPRGGYCRISPSSHTETNSIEEDSGSLSLDFHTKLDNLLKILVCTKPHFIRCIQSSPSWPCNQLDRPHVVQQVRGLQVLQTLHVMADGLPHRMRYSAFNHRYSLLVPSSRRSMEQTNDKSYTITKLILDHCDQSMDDTAGANWALGKKHIFLSEGSLQKLDRARVQLRYRCATLLQSAWRCHLAVRHWPVLKAQLIKRNKQRTNPGPPPMMSNAALYSSPPPLPASRSYTVCGNRKMTFPQTRVMTQPYSELETTKLIYGGDSSVRGDGGGRGCEVRADATYTIPEHKACKNCWHSKDVCGAFVKQGEEIIVVGTSRDGHLLVQWSTTMLHIPHQFTTLKEAPSICNDSTYSADV